MFFTHSYVFVKSSYMYVCSRVCVFVCVYMPFGLYKFVKMNVFSVCVCVCLFTHVLYSFLRVCKVQLRMCVLACVRVCEQKLGRSALC